MMIHNFEMAYMALNGAEVDDQLKYIIDNVIDSEQRILCVLSVIYAYGYFDFINSSNFKSQIIQEILYLIRDMGKDAAFNFFKERIYY